jgi:hypothetical protein
LPAFLFKIYFEKVDIITFLILILANIVNMGSCSVSQAGLEFSGSRDAPAFASSVTETTGMHHSAE